MRSPDTLEGLLIYQSETVALKAKRHTSAL